MVPDLEGLRPLVISVTSSLGSAWQPEPTLPSLSTFYQHWFSSRLPSLYLCYSSLSPSPLLPTISAPDTLWNFAITLLLLQSQPLPPPPFPSHYLATAPITSPLCMTGLLCSTKD